MNDVFIVNEETSPESPVLFARQQLDPLYSYIDLKDCLLWNYFICRLGQLRAWMLHATFVSLSAQEDSRLIVLFSKT